MKRLLGIKPLIGILVIVGGGALAFFWFNRAMGPSLDLNLPESGKSGSQSTANSEPMQVADDRPAIQQKFCGNSGQMRLVVVGHDSPNIYHDLDADAVRLIVVDFDAPGVFIMALPVNLWVSTPVLADQGIAQTTLNLVYKEAWESLTDNPDYFQIHEVVEVLAQTIVDNFGFVPDHYITIDESAFIQLIDEIGPVSVNLTSAVDGTSEGFGIYDKGLNELDGVRTLNLARLDHPSGQIESDVWGRLDRQDAVMQGLLKAALRAENIANAPALIRTIRKAITTDLSVNQATDLFCMVQEVGRDAVLQSVGPPPNLSSLDSQGHVVPNVQEIKDLLAKIEGGN